MTSLLLIRHAETDLAGTFCGRSDPAVNAAGLQQIRTLVQGLRSEQIQAVYTSDLQRAATTAHAVAEAYGIPCFLRPALREIDFCRWDGLCWSEIEAANPDDAAEWLKAFPNLPAPGGEPFHAFEARVLQEAEYLLHQSCFESMAVVTHAGVMRSMLRHLSGATDEEAWQLTKPYCAVLRLHHGCCEAVSA